MSFPRFMNVLTTLAALMALAVVLQPAIRAAVDDGTADQKETPAQRTVNEAREILAKYDANKDGLLDDEEAAVERADMYKAAAEKRKATLARKKAEQEGGAD